MCKLVKINLIFGLSFSVLRKSIFLRGQALADKCKVHNQIDTQTIVSYILIRGSLNRNLFEQSGSRKRTNYFLSQFG